MEPREPGEGCPDGACHKFPAGVSLTAVDALGLRVAARVDTSNWTERAAVGPPPPRVHPPVLDVRIGEAPAECPTEGDVQVLLGQGTAGPAPGCVVVEGTEDFLVRALIAIGHLVERPGTVCIDLADFRALFLGKGPVTGCSVVAEPSELGRDHLTGDDVERLALAASAELASRLAAARSVLLHFELGNVGALYPVHVAAAGIAEAAPHADLAFNVYRSADESRLTVLFV